MSRGFALVVGRRWGGERREGFLRLTSGGKSHYDGIAMNRRCIAWLASVPLMLGGTEVAHWLAFRLVYPDAFERAQALQETGHGYLTDWVPMAGGVAAALLVSALFLSCRDARTARESEVVQVGLSRFAALPPLAFTLQEHLERLIHSGTVVGVVLEPTFMLGLLLQVPFALAAYLLARLLLGVAGQVGRVFAQRRRSRRRSRLSTASFRSRVEFSVPRMAALAGGHAERGPPL